MGYRYAVLGSSRQGTAGAYDLARFGEAEYILVADQSLAQAEREAHRVNTLVSKRSLIPTRLMSRTKRL